MKTIEKLDIRFTRDEHIDIVNTVNELIDTVTDRLKYIWSDTAELLYQTLQQGDTLEWRYWDRCGALYVTYVNGDLVIVGPAHQIEGDPPATKLSHTLAARVSKRPKLPLLYTHVQVADWPYIDVYTIERYVETSHGWAEFDTKMKNHKETK